eukprot:CAMPEP_0197438612 /NCGR_PEP_ID=MMETSP1175-20131217/5547_1 /TAXON_ID=1003142 /ORGANISM="Triceratium dubium, Strain CCMP147" /LENGTH=34 /DNA_ID= /DNA_START= /DNA_END= /DNA_ORIENTATION=
MAMQFETMQPFCYPSSSSAAHAPPPNSGSPTDVS